MASMNKPVRPVRWNFGMGVGDALKQTGTMYGQLGQMQLDAEALEAERKWRQGERLAGQEFTAGQNQENRAHQTTEAGLDRAATLAAADTLAAEQERVRLADEAEAERVRLANAENDRENDERAAGRRSASTTSTWGSLTSEQQLEYANITGMSTEEIASKDQNQPWIIQINDLGEQVGQSSPDPDYVLSGDGNWVKHSNVSDDATAMEIEMRSASQYVLFDSALPVLEEVLTKYDLSSGQSLFDQATGLLGGAGNWIVSEEGQMYQAAINMANEALFKNLSGAAGSDAEAKRFERMFPAPGDSPAVVQMKMQILGNIASQMKAAGFNGLEQDAQAKQAWALTKQLANAEMGKNPDVFSSLPAGSDNDFIIEDFGIGLSATAAQFLDPPGGPPGGTPNGGTPNGGVPVDMVIVTDDMGRTKSVPRSEAHEYDKMNPYIGN